MTPPMTNVPRPPAEPEFPNDSAIPAGRLRVDILGKVSVYADETPVDVGPAMVRSLLAVLALHHGQTVSREKIIFALWGDDPPSTSKNLVQSYVSRLRARLRTSSDASPESDPAVKWDRAGYRLDVEPECVDLTRFDSLLREARRVRDTGDTGAAIEAYDVALGCWKGTILQDLEPRIRESAAAIAATERWIDAVMEYADLCRAANLRRQAIDRLRRATGVARRHEGLHARLMVTLAEAGDRASALDTYGAIKERLSEELGVDPGAELRTVYVTVLRDETPGRVVVSPSRSESEPDQPPRGRRFLRSRRARALLGAGVAVALAAAGVVASRFGDWTSEGWRGGTMREDFSAKRLTETLWRAYDEVHPNGSAWSQSMVRVTGGELQITGSGRNPTGAGNLAGGSCWCGHGAPERRYGVYQVRAKVDVGSGYGMEIGLYPSSNDEEADGLITIARIDQATRDTMYPVLRGENGSRYLSGSPVVGDFTGWSTYAVEWRKDFITILLDDRVVFDTRRSDQHVEIPSTKMFLYAQLKPGPNESVPGPGLDTPSQVVMHVDWASYSP